MLASRAGVEVVVLSFGAVLQSWRVPDTSGTPRQVTLGFDAFAPYPVHSPSFGIVAGRLANRVRDARFTLEGAVHQLDRNDGRHHLHGGGRGLGRQHWSLEADGRQARLSLTSPDGEMGYPGTVRFAATFTLEDHTLDIVLTGEPDRPTPIALAQHSYYALGGPVAAHRLCVAADRTTPADSQNVTTGAVVPLPPRLDYRAPRTIGEERLDTNFCLTGGAPAATLEGEHFRLALTTDRPGLQVYTADAVPPIPVVGLGGARYGPRCGIALEAQDWPDAVNHENFGSVIATPERPYRQHTRITIEAR